MSARLGQWTRVSADRQNGRSGGVKGRERLHLLWAGPRQRSVYSRLHLRPRGRWHVATPRDTPGGAATHRAVAASWDRRRRARLGSDESRRAGETSAMGSRRATWAARPPLVAAERTSSCVRVHDQPVIRPYGCTVGSTLDCAPRAGRKESLPKPWGRSPRLPAFLGHDVVLGDARPVCGITRAPGTRPGRIGGRAPTPRDAGSTYQGGRLP
jgi:hypothetical protein